MIHRSFFLIILIAGIALTIRLISLDLRPMHTDEAVHAIKFGHLLEEGYYRYDPNEYHGPTLNYLTLIPAWLLSQRKLSTVNEFTLRAVPAFLGSGLVILLLLVWHYMRRSTWILSAMFIALSPVVVFYSRYYIHEILLVFFLYGFLFFFIRWKDCPNIKWATWSGFFLGMMVATKETWIISIGALFASAMFLLFFDPKFRIRYLSTSRRLLRDLSWMTVCALVVAGLFFSSFLDNPKGISDSITAYTHYFNKAGDFNEHIHPWYYYLQLLIFNRNGGMIWTEAFLFIGGWIGFIFALKRKEEAESRFFLFISIFSLLSGSIFSMMPYKTPWNLLSFYTGWILLAGYGFSRILEVARSRKAKTVVRIMLFLIYSQLGYQAYTLNFVNYADPSNPWVYGHTGKDIFRLVEKVKQVAAAQPSGEDIRIDIIAAHHDYWPLPWYFRMFPNAGWWDYVNMEESAAPLIIASPEFEGEILRKIYEIPPPGQRYLYLPLFDETPELRPNLYLEGYVRKDAWDQWMKQDGIGNGID